MQRMNVKEFPTLYGMDKKQKVKSWSIKVYNEGTYSLLMLEYGYVDGKKITQSFKVIEGKNKHKKNATTHFSQAVLDAESKWTRKQTSDGYRETIELLSDKDTVLLPMLVHDYTKNKQKINFPCYTQPKLDGYRMTFQNGKCYSRSGKEFSILKNTELFKELMSLNLNNILDGELYIHDPDFNFENYGILRKDKLKNQQDIDKLSQIEYHVYDIILENQPFETRMLYLRRLLNSNLKFVKLVDTKECNNEQELEETHTNYIHNLYEGSIIRNSCGKYVPKYRNYDVMKYKNFDDAEFKIVGHTSEKDMSGGDDNLVVWICETENGCRFNVQSKGTREERQLIYKTADKYHGSKLWVQFFGKTLDGIPRFPKTKSGGLASIRNELF